MTIDDRRPDRDDADLDAAFAALADPTRRAIVRRLTAGEATVNELAAPFAMSLPAVSKHLKVLERAGLISRRVDAQRRPCRLRTDGLDAIERYVEHTRAAWEQRLDRLEHVLTTAPEPPASSLTPSSEGTPS